MDRVVKSWTEVSVPSVQPAVSTVQYRIFPDKNPRFFLNKNTGFFRTKIRDFLQRKIHVFFHKKNRRKKGNYQSHPP